MQTAASITRLVRWLCKQLNFDELLVALDIILEIINGKRDDIQFRINFREKYPNYRQFVVDPLAPFTEPPLKKVVPEADFKQIIKEHHLLTGKDIKPVTRHKNSQLPPSYARCKNCNAPARYHTRARCGFKNTNGAAVLTTLFVAYYSFPRPHTTLKFKPPIYISKLAGITTIQGKWLKMLEMAA